MPRGGYRKNAGGKPAWKHGQTKTIRVPIALADEILKLAHSLDEGKKVVILELTDSVSASKSLDLSGISVRPTNGWLMVSIADLVRSKYEIRPLGLAEQVSKWIKDVKN